MNDELQNQIAQLLAGAAKAGQSAVDFIIQQAPDVAQRIVAWQFWDNAITGGGLLVALISVFVGCSFWIHKAKNMEDVNKEMSTFFSIFIMVIASFILGGFSLSNFKEAAKAHISPKIVLIEYIRDFK